MTERICAVEGCNSGGEITRGFCTMHYQRWRKHGDPLAETRRQRQTCCIGGCDKPHEARGWCQMHYRRWAIHGDPTHGGAVRPHTPTGTAVDARFWAKVNKTDTCWLWTGAIDAKGYGAFWVNQARGRVLAHRYSWSLAGNELIDGLELDHLCRTPACVRPSHLEQVTHLENVRRATRR